MASRMTGSDTLPSRCGGFTYIGLLVAIVLFGLGSVGAARVIASAERQEKEQELLFVGAQFRSAIASYYVAVPGAARYPPSLAELLQDPRFPGIRRHLRKLFTDPVTGSTEWGLVRAPQGGIMGVYSLSTRAPLKRANFESPNGSFNAMAQLAAPETYSYQDWQFVYLPASK